MARHCPQAIRCADPFHVVRWATDALDEVRRQTWNAARRSGQVRHARQLKRARYALWKAPENLTARQRGHLAQIQRTNRTLYRAYLLAEQLREVFRHRGRPALLLLEAWLSWARRCRIPSFIELARRIAKHRGQIEATLIHGLSNALVGSVDTRIRLLARLAFGFRSPEALIGLAMLKLGGYCPIAARAGVTHPRMKQRSRIPRGSDPGVRGARPVHPATRAPSGDQPADHISMTTVKRRPRTWKWASPESRRGSTKSRNS